LRCGEEKGQDQLRVKYWEIIADNLSKAGWSWGCVSAVDLEVRTIWTESGSLGVRMKS
jgi:hypothetical protein